MKKIIGRTKEIKQLKEHLQSDKSEFVAVYGRRRVGKTFLIRQVFNNEFTFYLTGLANVGMTEQLTLFHAEMQTYFPHENNLQPAKTWFAAFRQLMSALGKEETDKKKVIFLDELPWLDTRNSKFLSGLEHFWNSWASARSDILLIVCGSAASWMVKNLLNNHGGLHNRITDRMKLEPFTLAETETYLQSKNMVYDRYQIITLYMVFGGIPFYLEKLKNNQSAMQNVNRLCFERNAPFRTEYENLYASLFNKHERHIAVVEALATKNKGLTRKEIATFANLPNGGGLTRILNELEKNSFIRKYHFFGKKNNNQLYQLIDAYSLFYLNFIKKSSVDDENYWLNMLETPKYRTWSGYAFEMVCLQHIPQIKNALGVSGVQTSVSTWQNKNAQIDLLIDRKDRVINLCEMKFSIKSFSISKKYAENLRNKIGTFREVTNTKKALFLTMVTTFGVANNKYKGLVQNDLTMDIFFE